MSNHHAAHYLVKHTQVGQQATAACVGGAVVAAKILGGAALAPFAVAAAPVVVPVALMAGLCYLASGGKKKH